MLSYSKIIIQHSWFNYGLVDQIDASLTKTRLLSFNCTIINSAKSSGCISLSSLLLMRLALFASSVTTVLGVKAVTLILYLRTSCINDSVRPITPNFEALYALVSALPFKPAVDDMLIISPVFLSIICGNTARVT